MKPVFEYACILGGKCGNINVIAGWQKGCAGNVLLLLLVRPVSLPLRLCLPTGHQLPDEHYINVRTIEGFCIKFLIIVSLYGFVCIANELQRTGIEFLILIHDCDYRGCTERLDRSRTFFNFLEVIAKFSKEKISE